MSEHAFDAMITLVYEPDAGDPGKQAAADQILEIGSEYGMAISLHDAGTLNVKALQDKLQACELQRDEWKKYADAGLSSYAELQAEVASYSSRLSSSEKESSDHIDRLNNRIALLDNERTELSSRLGVYLNQLRVGVEVVQHDPHGGATANWLAAVRELLAGCRNCGAATTALTNGWCDACMGITVVEKHERICGVPDPDDECEECIRPLGHDGEHDFSTPPE